MADKERLLFTLLKELVNDDTKKLNKLVGLNVTNKVYGLGRIKNVYSNNYGSYLYIDFSTRKNELFNLEALEQGLLYDLVLSEDLRSDIKKYMQELKNKAEAEKKEQVHTLKRILEQHDIKALYYITHINNLKSIFTNGFQCRNYLRATKQSFKDISDASVQKRRTSLHEYVNFYFADNTPMLYVVVNEFRDSVALLEILPMEIMNNELKFTNGNAASNETIFFDNLTSLSNLDWNIIKSKYPATSGYKKRIRSAEVLVEGNVKPNCIKCIHVASAKSKQIAISILRDLGKFITVKQDLTAEGIK